MVGRWPSLLRGAKWREREGEDKVREKEDIIQEDAFGSSVFFQRAL
jgi:hypothetical protein